ncbi:hypothetical protein [Kocuria sabuli]|uniref:hypothetical protein n=1 Tax=Kocuria sabuli TaxID=3071448 RepID=UPI0034D73A80
MLAAGTTDARGRFQVEREDDAELLLRVEADDVAAQERVVTGDRPEQVELFMLGRPGMPFYYRRNVQVPFEPVEGAFSAGGGGINGSSNSHDWSLTGRPDAL